MRVATTLPGPDTKPLISTRSFCFKLLMAGTLGSIMVDWLICTVCPNTIKLRPSGATNWTGPSMVSSYRIVLAARWIIWFVL